MKSQSKNLFFIDWQLIFLETDTVDELIKKFYDELYNMIEMEVPKKTISNKNFPPWFDNEAVNYKREVYCKRHELQSDKSFNAFSKKRSICKNLTEKYTMNILIM